KNETLETLLLAWNGFGYDGCSAMADALSQNTTLRTLDLTNNRIQSPTLVQLLPGLQRNKTLAVLKLSHNPITANMTSVLIAKIYDSKESNLKELDLQGIVVDKEFDGILQSLQKERLFLCAYDQSLPLNKGPIPIDPRNVFNIDPVRIVYYMK
ncbi:LR74B-like protein, partial [Mya arenaria]